MSEKRIAVVTAESGQIRDMQILPGTTTSDVRRHLGLDSQYLLSTGRGDPPFGEDENIYERLSDGAKVFASTPVEVGGTSAILAVICRSVRTCQA